MYVLYEIWCCWWYLTPFKMKPILHCLELWIWLTSDQAILHPFLFWRRGEKGRLILLSFSLSLKKKRLIAGEKIVGKIDRGFFSFPPEGFERTLVCVRNTLKLKSHIILIRLLILILTLVAKRCLLRLRWAAIEEAHLGEGWGKNPLPCPYICTSTHKSLV